MCGKTGDLPELPPVEKVGNKFLFVATNCFTLNFDRLFEAVILFNHHDFSIQPYFPIFESAEKICLYA